MNEYSFNDFSLFVVCKACGKQHDTADIRIVSVEADLQGADVVAFLCPVVGEMTSSRVYKGVAHNE